MAATNVYKYFSLLRPIMPGTFPKEGKLEHFNLNRRQYCSEINREAWGWILYDRELTEREARSYDLRKEGDRDENEE